MCNSRVRGFPAVACHVHVIASTNFLFQRRGTSGGVKTSLSTIRWNIYGRLHVVLHTGKKWTDGERRERCERASGRRTHETHVRWRWPSDSTITASSVHDDRRRVSSRSFTLSLSPGTRLRKAASFRPSDNCIATQKEWIKQHSPVDIAAQLLNYHWQSVGDVRRCPI